MPVFSVKNILTAPENNVEKMEMFVEIEIPREIFILIMMKLDGRSLCSAQLVSNEWNSIIKEEIMGTVRGRQHMKRILKHQWSEAIPTMLHFTIPHNERVLTIDGDLAVILSESILPTIKFKVVNIRMELTVMELPYILPDYIHGALWPGFIHGALLSNSVLLAVRRVPGHSMDEEVVAWAEEKEIFKKRFPMWDKMKFDQKNSKVMVGRNMCLTISGNTIIEADLCCSANIRNMGHECIALSHSEYITCDELDKTATIFQVHETGMSRRNLGFIGWKSVFCPARQILVSCYKHQNSLEITVHNTVTWTVKIFRELTLPCHIFPDIGLDVNKEQLVVHGICPIFLEETHFKYVLLVLDLDSILSQTPDQDISFRIFDIGKSDSLNMESLTIMTVDTRKISAAVNTKNIKKIITLDFWNCET